MSKKELQFEQAMERLEGVIQKLEEGDLALENSLKAYEDGVELIRFCEQKLAEAEGKIAILMKDRSGKKGARPFNLKEDPETKETVEEVEEKREKP